MKAGAVPSLFALPGKPHGLPRSGFFLFSAIKFNKNMYSSAYGRTEHVFYKEGLIFCWNNRRVYDNGQFMPKLHPEEGSVLFPPLDNGTALVLYSR